MNASIQFKRFWSTPASVFRTGSASILWLFIALPLVVSFWAYRESLLQNIESMSSATAINSLLLTIGVTVAAMLSSILALFLSHFTGRLEKLFVALNVLWMLIPEYSRALAWSFLFRPKTHTHESFSAIGIHFPELTKGYIITSLVLYFHVLPLCILLIYALKQRLLSDWHSAKVHLSPMEFLSNIAWPTSFPFLAFVFLVAFSMVFSNFTLPDLFQVTVFSAEIFADIAAYQQIPLAYAKVLAMSLLFLLLFLLFQGSIFKSILLLRVPASQVKADKVLMLPSIGLIFLASLLLFLPITALIMETNSWSNFLKTFNWVLNDLSKNILITLIGSLTILIFSYAFTQAYLLSHTKQRTKVAWLSLVLLWCFPNTLLAISALSLWNNNLTGPALTDSPWLMIIIFALAWLPILCYILQLIVVPSAARSRQAASTNGLSLWQSEWLLSVFPNRISLFLVFIIIWILLNNDSAISLLLAPPGYDNVMLRIYSTVHYGPEQMIAGLNLAYLAVLAFLLAAAWWCSRYIFIKRNANVNH